MVGTGTGFATYDSGRSTNSTHIWRLEVCQDNLKSSENHEWWKYEWASEYSECCMMLHDIIHLLCLVIGYRPMMVHSCSQWPTSKQWDGTNLNGISLLKTPTAKLFVVSTNPTQPKHGPRPSAVVPFHQIFQDEDSPSLLQSSIQKRGSEPQPAVQWQGVV